MVMGSRALEEGDERDNAASLTQILKLYSTRLVIRDIDFDLGAVKIICGNFNLSMKTSSANSHTSTYRLTLPPQIMIQRSQNR